MKEITLEKCGQSLWVVIPKELVASVAHYPHAKHKFVVRYKMIDENVFSTIVCHILEIGESKVFKGTYEGVKCLFAVKRPIGNLYTVAKQ
jgi:hypothetical protein